MADTGAPWNLPYPLGTDLVRDGAQAIQDLAEAAATGLSNIPVLAGIGSNVVQAGKANTFSIASTTFTDVTGLSLSFTPTLASSRVLLLVSVTGVADSTGGAAAWLRVLRNSTAIGVGDAATAVSFIFDQSSSVNAGFGAGVTILDSPSTTSAITYKVQMRHTSGTVFVNRSQNGNARSFSSITAIEVAV
jgi:hypothetical protein